jgi:hypothetical protein
MTRAEFLEYVEDQILPGVAGTVSASKLRTLLNTLAESAAFVKADIGLGNVDNTTDLNKPVSFAMVSALALKVDKVVGKQLSTEDFSTGEKAKLTAIATGATANATDAQLRDRTTHTGTQAAATITGLSAVATTGAYTDLSGRPTLGTVASLNVAASGDAGSTEIVRGNDTRLTNNRAPTAHNHSATEITSGILAADRLAAGTALQVYRRNAANNAIECATISTGLGDMQRTTYDTDNDGIVDAAEVALSVVWANVSGKPSFSTVATTGVYADLTSKPALGSSAARDVGTTAGSVAAGDDSRFHVHSNTVQLDKITEAAGLPLWNGGAWPGGGGGGGDMFKSVYDVNNDGIVDVAATANAVTWTNVSSKPTFATVATTGAYNDLTGKPTLGSAAALDVPVSGDATSGQVVRGSDGRLTNPRTPTAHNHVATEITTGVLGPDRLAAGTALQVFRRNAGNTAIECATISIGSGDMLKTENLSGLADYGTARSNLGLGNSATLSVGTAASTVAAGDDTRIANAVQTSRTVSTTAPLTGGGALSSNLTLAISPATTGAAGSLSASDKTKLDSVAAGATVNASDASLRDRSTHTGTQAATTLTGTLAPDRVATGTALQIFRRNSGNSAVECVTLSDTDLAPPTPTSVTSSANISLDCSRRTLDLTLTHNTTFTTSNLAAGRTLNLRILTDASIRTFVWPAGWIWVGGTAPGSQAASKSGLLALQIWGASDSSVQAAYAVQP